MKLQNYCLLGLCMLLSILLKAQATLSPTQNIRGTLVDQDSQAPLIGATVVLGSSNPVKGVITDLDGSFLLENIPVGRHQLSISYIGYEPLQMSGIILSSGKELVLNLELVESTTTMDEIVITAKTDKSQALNEFATVSARSFSVEETSRYAGSYYDPARMAQNFAGVSTGGGDDLMNEIIVRGNSPKGLLWKLEGIEIPNPNHFGLAGSSGGGISMLSSTTLSNSDFYTGAFPAEFGNASAGVFDLNLRNGNNQQREYAFMFGLLGIEFGLEGPFSKNSKGSYLINYRYSTLKALEDIGLSPVDDVLPKYQDLSFKINLPTQKAGTFALFGLGGNNSASFTPNSDPTQWEDSGDRWGFVENQKVGVIGLSHKILTSEKSYLKTILSASAFEGVSESFYLDSLADYTRHEDGQDLVADAAFRISSTYNHKFNAKNTIRAGAILSALNFRFTYDEDNGDRLVRSFDNKGNTHLLQSFFQWKYRWNEKWTLNTGLHYTHFMLNGKNAIEPRAAVKYQVTPRSSLSAALGLHSKLEHLATYLFDGTFQDGSRHDPGDHLGLSKAMHAVLGFDQKIGKSSRIKVEGYFQHLYNIPIEDDPESKASLLNASNIWEILGFENAVNEGIGRNVGVDLTLEKFFDQSYYFLITGSLYDSKYKAKDGQWYNSRYNGNYQLSLLGGKEFRIGKKNLFGINTKFLFSGGRRFTPLNEAASFLAGEAIYFEDQPYAEKTGDYRRIDFGISYRINKLKTTHSILLDIQNVTNRQNLFGQFYNEDSNQIEKFYQTGFFPVLNYRIEF